MSMAQAGPESGEELGEKDTAELSRAEDQVWAQRKLGQNCSSQGFPFFTLSHIPSPATRS